MGRGEGEGWGGDGVKDREKRGRREGEAVPGRTACVIIYSDYGWYSYSLRTCTCIFPISTNMYVVYPLQILISKLIVISKLTLLPYSTFFKTCSTKVFLSLQIKFLLKQRNTT